MGDREITILVAWVVFICIAFIVYNIIYSGNRRKIAIKNGLKEGIIVRALDNGTLIDLYVSNLDKNHFSGKNIHTSEHMELYYYQFVNPI